MGQKGICSLGHGRGRDLRGRELVLVAGLEPRGAQRGQVIELIDEGLGADAEPGLGDPETPASPVKDVLAEHIVCLERGVEDLARALAQDKAELVWHEARGHGPQGRAEMGKGLKEDSVRRGRVGIIKALEREGHASGLVDHLVQEGLGELGQHKLDPEGSARILVSNARADLLALHCRGETDEVVRRSDLYADVE